MTTGKSNRNIRSTRAGVEATALIRYKKAGLFGEPTGSYKRASARSERRANKQLTRGER